MTDATPDESRAGTSAAADAPGKINLTLDVLGQREDGFHELRSLAIGVGLADRIRCQVRSAPGVTLRCSDPALAGDDNLAVTAARALQRHSGLSPGVAIDLTKQVPVGSGMGGGSSDAACTLRLCNHLLSAGLDRAALAAIGATLGSDVPLFFHLPAALITGRGEHVEPVELRWSGWVLLAFAGVAVSTAEVYRAWRRTDGRRMPTQQESAIAQATTAAALSSMLSNHLEPAVFRVAPAVAQAYEALRRLGHTAIRVSGAGSALYQLFDEKEAAEETAREVEGIGMRTSVVAAPVRKSEIQ